MAQAEEPALFLAHDFLELETDFYTTPTTAKLHIDEPRA